MPFQSTFPPLDIPKCNIVDYMFPKDQQLTDTSIWMEAANPTNGLSQQSMLLWSKRFALGLDRLGVEKGRTVMVVSGACRWIVI